MKPTEEQIKVLLKIQQKWRVDDWKGNITFEQYVDVWWDFWWDRRHEL